ncbi:2-oxo acid dehydrogenase subunit E2 [Bradyrhizobium sp. 5.13L]
MSKQVPPVFDAIPLTPIRRMIAARMTEAKQTIPHYRLSASMPLDPLIALRRELIRERGLRLTVNDLLVKVTAAALIDVPAVNVQWSEDEIQRFHDADISIVIATEHGVSTPIIRAANRKSVFEISSEIRELAERAAVNRLRMDELIGGSFSISNLGMYGVEQFDAIINAPQCAILAVGCAGPKAQMRDDGGFVAETMATMTLSVDHRAIDGKAAAIFLQALRHRLHDPGSLVAQETAA